MTVNPPRWEEDEDVEDPGGDEMKGTSALFLQG